MLMIGDGPLRGAVEARASELGVSEALRITGLQQDVRPYLATCDALALPSSTEALRWGSSPLGASVSP